MIVIPEKVEELSGILAPTREELKLITAVKKVAGRDDILLVKIFPASGIKADLFIIDRKEGAFFVFSIIPTGDLDKALRLVEEFLLPLYSEKLIDRICSHRQLANDNTIKIEPLIPISLAWFIQNSKRQDAPNTTFVDKHCIFIDDLQNIQSPIYYRKMLRQSCINPMDWSGFTSHEINALFHAVAPEYRIPKIDVKVDSNINPWKLDLNESITIGSKSSEAKIKALSLTSEQIELVNKCERGAQMILSCAGSGKSIILAARAIKIAKAYENKQVLLTCYNKTLKEYMDFCIDAAGLKFRNMNCKTFHGLCRYLLDINDRPLPPNGPKYFEQLPLYLRAAISQGKILQRYFAVFIDEIQDFKPEWYQICLDLLENKNNYIINICGDKSQDIYRILEGGLDPWEIGPEYKENMLSLEKNFRATDEIIHFIDFMGKSIKGIINLLGSNDCEVDNLYRSGTTSGKHGPIPEIIYAKNLAAEIEEVVKKVKWLHDEQGVPYSDIAIIYPFKRVEPMKIYTEYFLTKAFDDAQIPCTVLSTSDSQDSLSSYHTRAGVVLTTIFGVKGVDFKAVIICGLKALRPESISQQLEDNESLTTMRNFNLLYTAATRAEKYLYWILLRPPARSIYSKVIQDAVDEVAASHRLNNNEHSDLDTIFDKWKVGVKG